MYRDATGGFLLRTFAMMVYRARKVKPWSLPAIRCMRRFGLQSSVCMPVMSGRSLVWKCVHGCCFGLQLPDPVDKQSRVRPPLSMPQVVLRLRRPGASTWPITRALRAVAAWPLSQARRLGFLLFIQGMITHAPINAHDCHILQPDDAASDTNPSTSCSLNVCLVLAVLTSSMKVKGRVGLRGYGRVTINPSKGRRGRGRWATCWRAC